MTLSFDPDTLALDAGHFIGGGAVAGAFGMALRRPSDRGAFVEAPTAGAEIVDRAVETTQRALRSLGWDAAPSRYRTCAMHARANLLDAEAPGLSGLEAICSKRPVGQSVPTDIQGEVA
jgi:aldehyde dehydrogenase (NAD+)